MKNNFGYLKDGLARAQRAATRDHAYAFGMLEQIVHNFILDVESDKKQAEKNDDQTD